MNRRGRRLPSAAQITREFWTGVSMVGLARKYGRTTLAIEVMIRAVARRDLARAGRARS